MKKTAAFSRCRQYRYALWRTWESTQKQVLFICLNPSIADEENDDPTLIRCINYAKSWGFGSVCIANLFAYKATKPYDLLANNSPIGPRNNHWLKKLADESDLCVAAWGNHGSYLGRSAKVQKLIPNLHYLKITKLGEPAHPLYLKASFMPIPWQ